MVLIGQQISYIFCTSYGKKCKKEEVYIAQEIQPGFYCWSSVSKAVSLNSVQI